MNREQIAAALNANAFREDIIQASEDTVVIYCIDEKNLQFRGALQTSLLCYDDARYVIHKNKGVLSVANLESIVVDAARSQDVSELEAQEEQQTISVVRNPDEPVHISWIIESSLAYSTFDIINDGRLLCRGIVIDVADIRE